MAGLFVHRLLAYMSIDGGDIYLLIAVLYIYGWMANT